MAGTWGTSCVRTDYQSNEPLKFGGRDRSDQFLREIVAILVVADVFDDGLERGQERLVVFAFDLGEEVEQER